jgi:hypothetical protein
MPLTDAKCKNAEAKDKPYKLADGHGLYLEISPKGSKYWRMKYYFLGKEKRAAFGVYPEVSLAEARQKQTHAKKLLESGIDPVQAKADKKLADTVKHLNNFEAVARDWHSKNKEMWVQRHSENVMARLEKDTFPMIGHRPIADITTPELKTVLDKIEERKAYDIAKRTRQVCDQIFRYAIGIGITERNVARDLQGTLKKVEAGHFSSFEIGELKEFLRRVGAGAGSYVGNGSGQIWAAGAGLLAGAIAGAAAEQAAANSTGVEYVVTTEQGKTMTIVQNMNPGDVLLPTGSRVMVQTSGSYQRVLPADALPESIKRPKGIKVTD